MTSQYKESYMFQKYCREKDVDQLNPIDRLSSRSCWPGRKIECLWNYGRGCSRREANWTGRWSRWRNRWLMHRTWSPGCTPEDKAWIANKHIPAASLGQGCSKKQLFIRIILLKITTVQNAHLLRSQGKPKFLPSPLNFSSNHFTVPRHTYFFFCFQLE